MTRTQAALCMALMALSASAAAQEKDPPLLESGLLGPVKLSVVTLPVVTLP